MSLTYDELKELEAAIFWKMIERLCKDYYEEWMIENYQAHGNGD